ncbi:transporter associated domain-containing protein [Escherichia coli]
MSGLEGRSHRDENSWLIDGGTPIDDVMRVLDLASSAIGDYETIGGSSVYAA